MPPAFESFSLGRETGKEVQASKGYARAVRTECAKEHHGGTAIPVWVGKVMVREDILEAGASKGRPEGCTAMAW